MSKNILYIGNKLTQKTKYPTTMESLINNLGSEGYVVYSSSNKLNKALKLLDMCFSVFYYRNKIDYLLIDTYSTANFYYALLTSQIARLFKIKYIPILHGGNLPNRLNNSKNLSKLIFNNSYKNVAPSNYLKHEFDKKKYPSVLIPNVIKIEDYKFKERSFLKPKLLYVRAFAEIYNPQMALYVLEKLIKKYPESKLCMVGPDKDGTLKDVKKLAKSLKIENHIEYTGVLLKKDWHKKSIDYDIFINTTNVDNTPISVIEAMALGLPIVSTNVGGIPYLIANNEDGLLVDCNNANQMTEKIMLLLEGKFPKIANNARDKVEKYNWEVVKDKWFEILK